MKWPRKPRQAVHAKARHSYPGTARIAAVYMLCRKRKRPDLALDLGSDGLEKLNLVQSIKCCGFCGNHYSSCLCKGLDRGSMIRILHPAYLPKLPAEMSPADQPYRWHVLYQATSIMNCGVHQTEYFLKEYTGAVAHFATKNKQLLVAAANAYVASFKKPFSWDDIKTDVPLERPTPCKPKAAVWPHQHQHCGQAQSLCGQRSRDFWRHTVVVHVHLTCLCQDVADQGHSNPAS